MAALCVITSSSGMPWNHDLDLPLAGRAYRKETYVAEELVIHYSCPSLPEDLGPSTC